MVIPGEVRVEGTDTGEDYTAVGAGVPLEVGHVWGLDVAECLDEFPEPPSAGTSTFAIIRVFSPVLPFVPSR